MPLAIVKRLDAVSKATGQSRTDVVLYLLRYGLEQWEASMESK
jgi:hypothetical protein